MTRSLCISSRPLTSDPAPRLLPQPREKLVTPAARKICLSPVPFFNNCSDGKAGTLAGLGPINKETYSQVSCDQADTNPECSTSTRPHALRQHVQTGFDGDHEGKWRLIFIKGTANRKHICPGSHMKHKRRRGGSPEPTANVFVTLH